MWVTSFLRTCCRLMNGMETGGGIRQIKKMDATPPSPLFQYRHFTQISPDHPKWTTILFTCGFLKLWSFELLGYKKPRTREAVGCAPELAHTIADRRGIPLMPNAAQRVPGKRWNNPRTSPVPCPTAPNVHGIVRLAH